MKRKKCAHSWCDSRVLTFCPYSIRLPCAKRWSNGSALPVRANWLALLLSVMMLPETVACAHSGKRRKYIRARSIHHLHRLHHLLGCSIVDRACKSCRRRHRRCPLFSKWSIHWWISLRTENQCNCEIRKRRSRENKSYMQLNLFSLETNIKHQTSHAYYKYCYFTYLWLRKPTRRLRKVRSDIANRVHLF